MHNHTSNLFKHFNLRMLLILPCIFITSCSDTIVEKNSEFQPEKLMVRIAEIEIDSRYVEEYIAILKEEAEASVRLETGVICIFPMFQKGKPTEIRLLEIYANKDTYDAHLKTPHFKKYKTTTSKMVKDLKLIDMNTIDTESMSLIFDKLGQ